MSNDFPIPKHPSWDIIDPSKLTDFQDCPRLFFYSHLLGWRVDAPAQDLTFGTAWHEAMEYLLLNGYEDTKGAYDAFVKCYRKDFDPSTDEIYPAKNPTTAALALGNYAGRYRRDLVENEVLFTEISGTVPIDDQGRNLYFRMDSILRNKEKGYYFSWDHKTKGGPFSRIWEDNFFLSLQTGTYTHCMYCIYPPELVRGIEYNGTSFRHLKRSGPQIDFRRVPAWKTPAQMNTWLWNTLDLVHTLESELERFAGCSIDDPILMAFPLNPNRCTKYYGCRFHDFCMSWANPLQRCIEPPLGYHTEFWDPREMDTTHKVELKWNEE